MPSCHSIAFDPRDRRYFVVLEPEAEIGAAYSLQTRNEVMGVILRHVITSTALRRLIYQIMMKKNRDIIFRPTLKLKTHISSRSSRQQTGAQSHVNF